MITNKIPDGRLPVKLDCGYTVRRTTPDDIARMQEIYAAARERMHSGGNPTQWIKHPTLRTLLEDIDAGTGFILEAEDGSIAGTFAFFLDGEPDYAVIDGEWLNDEPYGTIHRIAGDGIHRGIVAAAVEFGGLFSDNIRIDTHANNAPMHAALSKLGFTFTGVIHIEDEMGPDSPRDAFQKKLR